MGEVASKPISITAVLDSAAAAKTGNRRKRGRPRSQKSERAILDAAMALLIQAGYDGLTLEKVAARARVSKATIYRRWTSKEQLVVAALDQMPPLQTKARGPVLRDLTSFLQRFIDFVYSAPSHLKAETRMVTMLPSIVTQCATNPELAAALAGFLERRRHPMKTILQGAIARGELPATLNIDAAIDALMGPIVMRLFLAAGDTRRASTRELVRLVVEGLRHGP
jgi:AcrR family transcriptional regulator